MGHYHKEINWTFSIVLHSFVSQFQMFTVYFLYFKLQQVTVLQIIRKNNMGCHFCNKLLQPLYTANAKDTYFKLFLWQYLSSSSQFWIRWLLLHNKPSQKIVWWFFSKLKRITIWPSHSTPQVCTQKNLKSRCSNNNLHTNGYSVNCIHNGQKAEANQVSINRWRVLEMDGGDGWMTSVNVLNTRGLDTDKQLRW